MRSLVFATAMLAVALPAPPIEACVGKTLRVGVSDTPRERLLAELISTLVSERTGTTVEVKVFANPTEIHSAAKRGEVGILIENSTDALTALGLSPAKDSTEATARAKETFRTQLNLVWLESFFDLEEKGAVTRSYAPVISTEVMRNFPALPRVINKLARALDARQFDKLVAALQSGGEVREVARTFLLDRRLI